MDSKTARIRALNDELRQNFAEGIAVMTPGIAALGAEAVARLSPDSVWLGGRTSGRNDACGPQLVRRPVCHRPLANASDRASSGASQSASAARTRLIATARLSAPSPQSGLGSSSGRYQA